ncbi:xylosidase xlnD [Aspergillus sclerotioniger CBS 115572]|uniref:xylan 1,4-beta-xylosidase n=1 Tax=Aspergillus sclerotioniger CBS 115572 TaxID=1450535 RepID=A0A317XCF4_9EURO|nr:xylosidase xlnD [Aspergillus sclerotioniger CBS 115572]PWY95287.1 xylosidase xlnD [Aspergillus sclerotioniger CBS 115572]
MAALLAFAALLPTALGQANTSYVNYSIEANPDLWPLCVATLPLSFPDCSQGPLSSQLVCDTSATPYERAANLISLFTLEELIANTGNSGLGVSRLGLPPYQVWSEALHGLDRANFTDAGAYEWATSFPQPILTTAALNRTLIHQIASIISTQGRAFNNAGRYGLDVYAPNINAFRHPVWGRGQETPGEDVTLAAAYAYEYITGIQGDGSHLKLAATAKHFAGYDLENWHNHSRLGNDVIISPQDLSEYYTPQFHVAARDAHVHSVMCSYNAVNGIPTCASPYLLQTLLRDTFSFLPDGYVSSDCDAVYNIYNPHAYASSEAQAAADALRAGTDIDCGTTYQWHFNESVIAGEVARTDIERGLIRLYTTLVRLGYFDSTPSPYRNLSWSDVVSTDAWNVSYEAAVQGIVLLKNTQTTLPLTSSPANTSIALIGPWANATTQLQGNYYGTPPYLISPLAAFESSGYTVHFAPGTGISSINTTGFSAALSAAQSSDVIIYAGGIDNTIEAEALDRESIAWPGNQLSLIHELATYAGSTNKPLIVLQMGGGQVDSSSLKSNPNVSALIWGGYPGQSGGAALRDILTGVRAPAGRLVTTQYPASYAESFSALDMSLRPDNKSGNPGQTYKWYTGESVYEFGHGLFYTTFDEQPTNNTRALVFNIQDILSQPHPGEAVETITQNGLFNFTAQITNTGTVESDYTAMVFANTSDAGPAPYPNKWVVGWERLAKIEAGESRELRIEVPIGGLARVDVNGDWVVYPGSYEIGLNLERKVVVKVVLEGEESVVVKWPEESS